MDATRARSEKGLKGGALGLISSTVVGVASTAPAYSLAATLGFVVVLIGVKSPIVTILAFVPMLLVSVAYNELNRANPDCGTTFTWATRAFRPSIGWAGRLGNRRRGHPRHGEPRPDRRSVRVPALQLDEHRQRRVEWLGAARRHPLDRRDDRDLLRRHRSLGQLPKGVTRHRAHDADRAFDRCPRESRQRHCATRSPRGLRVPGSIPSTKRSRVSPRPDADAFHLLGLGHGRVGKRGDGESQSHSRAGSGHLDVHPPCRLSSSSYFQHSPTPGSVRPESDLATRRTSATSFRCWVARSSAHLGSAASSVTCSC